MIVQTSESHACISYIDVQQKDSYNRSVAHFICIPLKYRALGVDMRKRHVPYRGKYFAAAPQVVWHTDGVDENGS